MQKIKKKRYSFKQKLFEIERGIRSVGILVGRTIEETEKIVQAAKNIIKNEKQ